MIPSAVASVREDGVHLPVHETVQRAVYAGSMVLPLLPLVIGRIYTLSFWPPARPSDRHDRPGQARATRVTEACADRWGAGPDGLCHISSLDGPGHLDQPDGPSGRWSAFGRALGPVEHQRRAGRLPGRLHRRAFLRPTAAGHRPRPRRSGPCLAGDRDRGKHSAPRPAHLEFPLSVVRPLGPPKPAKLAINQRLHAEV